MCVIERSEMEGAGHFLSLELLGHEPNQLSRLKNGPDLTEIKGYDHMQRESQRSMFREKSFLKFIISYFYLQIG